MKYTSILLCLLFAITTTSFTAVKAQVNVNDSLALIDLYNSTDGPNWTDHTNWLTTKPVSTWHGVDLRNNRAYELDLNVNNLNGAIPASIGNLTALFAMEFEYNNLTDSIPASIGNLTNLVFLDLYNNQLSGSIPSAIGNLISIRQLSLLSNHLSGVIPASIVNLPNILYLNLAINQFSGTIPLVIGNLITLTDLYLSDNLLTGNIPSSIGNLINMQTLVLRNNKLSGSIPLSIGNLPALINLYLDHNMLTGDVPVSLMKLRNLANADISQNNLTFNKNINHPAGRYNFGYMNISNNRFTFDGIEFFGQPEFPFVTYSPQAQISIHQHGDTLSVLAGGTLSNNTYKWFKVGEVNPTVIEGNSTFTPPTSGKYYVKVINAIATRLVLYSHTFNFLMNNLNANDRIANDVINSKINQNFSIYPNPAINNIHILTNGAANITLTNSAGKILLSKTINKSDEINVSQFANGIYYLQNKTTGETQKMIVIH